MLADPFTSQSPALSGDDVGTCPAVVKTFLNEDACVKSTECSSETIGSASVPLNDATLRAWYTLSGVYAYYVQGLRLEDPYRVSPCAGTSRWTITAGSCSAATTTMDPTTLATLTAALRDSTDTNTVVRDISISGANCVDTAEETIGAQIEVDGNCFEHVHPNLFDVRDFTLWTNIHDGNPSAAAGGRCVRPLARPVCFLEIFLS